MYEIPTERPVEPFTLEVLEKVSHAFSRLGIKYFLAGAMARDILLTNVFDIPTGRATRDIDMAVAVESWEQFNEVKSLLVGEYEFNASEHVEHRLYYRKENTENGYPLDLVPFGGVANSASEIAWPPDLKVIMNVAGYEEVYTSAVSVQIKSDLVIPVASLPGLTLLKLFAWQDRGQDQSSSKDAEDLLTLLRNYVNAGNRDRLYETETSILEEASFDPDIASPMLLAKDMSHIASEETLKTVEEILNNTSLVEKLAMQMAGTTYDFEEKIEYVNKLISKFKIPGRVARWQN